MQLHIVQSHADIDAVRTLFRAYGEFLEQHGINVCLSGLDKELAALPSPYIAPDGAILIARSEEGDALGCVALKKRTLTNGERACELKRLYVTPASRGTGAGHALMQAAIDWARQQKYESIVLDTQPQKMPQAVRLYLAFGFEQTERFNDNPVPDINFFRLPLV